MFEKYFVKILVLLLFLFLFFFPVKVLALEPEFSIPEQFFTDYNNTLTEFCINNPTHHTCGVYDGYAVVPLLKNTGGYSPAYDGYILYQCITAYRDDLGQAVLPFEPYFNTYLWYFRVRASSVAWNKDGMKAYGACRKIAINKPTSNTWYVPTSFTGSDGMLNPQFSITTAFPTSLFAYFYSTSTTYNFNGRYGGITGAGVPTSPFQISSPNWYPKAISIPVIPIAGPPELKEFTLEYYTEDYVAPEYIQASSDEPCTVDLSSGLAGYYDLICPSVDFNLGDSSVPSLVLTNNVFTIFIPDISTPCTHIKSINYSLFDTTGQFLCSPITNPISSYPQLPQIPLIGLIPPEADWGAFDFLKPAINLFLGAFNTIIQAINTVLTTVLGWFIPNPDTIRTSVNDIKALFAEKLPLEALATGFTNVKNAMLSEQVVRPPDITGNLLGISVPFVKWDLVDSNITLIRNILNAIFYLSLLLVLSNLGRKATGQTV